MVCHKIAKNKQFTMILTFITILMVSAYFMQDTSAQTQTTTQIVPEANFGISPFRTQLLSVNYEDYFSGQLISTKTLASSTYHDTFGGYPDAATWISQPFLTDSSGLVAFNSQNFQELLIDSTTILDAEFENGTHVILQQVDLCYDIAVRVWMRPLTKTRLDYVISPLTGLTYSGWEYVFDGHENNEVQDPVDPNRLAVGVILADIDVGKAPWGLTWHNGGPLNPQTQAKITSALPEWVSDPGNIDWYIQRTYSNKPLIIRPKIQFDAYENFFNYDYYKVINNRVFHIFDSDTEMAITNIELVDSFSDAGEIESYLEPQGLQAPLNSQDPYGQGGYSATDLVADEEPTSTVTRDGKVFSANHRFVYDDYYQQDRGYLSNPVAIDLEDFEYPTQISLTNFDNLDRSAKMSFPVTISPKYDVFQAHFNTHYVGVAWSGLPFNHYTDIVAEADLETTFPYRIVGRNTYAINRIKVSLLLKSSTKVDYVPAFGSPINVDDLQDYEIADAGVLNPDRDSLSVQTISVAFSPFDFGSLFDIDTGFIIFIVIAIVIVVVVIFAISLVSRFSISRRRRN